MDAILQIKKNPSRDSIVVLPDNVITWLKSKSGLISDLLMIVILSIMYVYYIDWIVDWVAT
jgi:Ca2+-dependent lipid-binding protein